MCDKSLVKQDAIFGSEITHTSWLDHSSVFARKRIFLPSSVKECALGWPADRVTNVLPPNQSILILEREKTEQRDRLDCTRRKIRDLKRSRRAATQPEINAVPSQGIAFFFLFFSLFSWQSILKAPPTPLQTIFFSRVHLYLNASV